MNKLKQKQSNQALHMPISDLTKSYFKECPTCASKPGSPELCDSCLHNRRLVSQLQEALVASEKSVAKLLQCQTGDSDKGCHGERRWKKTWREHPMNAEKHCNLKLSVRLEDMSGLWGDLPDDKRMEVLKSIIWTAPDMHEFHEKAQKLINSQSFQDTLD